ncbi:histone deacetylase 11-like [Dysidea avara]|uniref:histone deacetylase 11-like n=1 Tax=Dysidea avara TaxID=196820 RepID=UPI003323FAEF
MGQGSSQDPPGDDKQSQDDDAVPSGAVAGPRLYTAKFGNHQWPIKVGQNHKRLVTANILRETKEDIVEPLEITEDELLVVHTQEYLNSLKSSYNVALITEVAPVAIVPNFVLQRKLLSPFREQTGGTVLAGKLARDRGWSINIGGGFHHCSSSEGGGFCAYADITLCIKFMFNHLDNISKVLVLDLDAHQGNGYERDLGMDSKVFIADVYNRWIYPNDREAKRYIDKRIELDLHTEDTVYLGVIKTLLPEVLNDFKPDMVIYNAGTDILKGDPLGLLDITDEGVRDRDELVFTEVRKNRGIPILMLTSGGYQRNNAEIIANSIINLHSKGLITGPSE